MKTVLGFHDFRDEERVVAIVRHHWWVLFRDIFGLVIMFLVPFFLIPIAFAIVTQGGTSAPAIPGGVILFFAAAWTLIIWNLLFARWTDFYYDIWIITNWRIIDIDQHGFFHRDVSTLLTLDHIEDIEASVKGIIGSLLNFGHVQVQTAGTQDVFDIDDVPNPPSVDQMIREAQEEQIRTFGMSHVPRRDGIYEPSAQAPDNEGPFSSF
ncbi:MAG: hypothetical protein KGI73_02460 [Patescibacteria group bacterium]|nr:hypothetical protein [Patescibacteria group bacterium]